MTIYLELHVSIHPSSPQSVPFNVTLEYEGEGKEEIDLRPDQNLITRVALYVLRCHGQATFPAKTLVKVINNIPLGRGLGSSGAAVVAGVTLGNEVGNLGLSKLNILDYALMVER